MTTKPERKAPAWLITLIFSYVVMLAGLTVLSRSGADRWWFGALNLYLPQVVWAVPGMFLAAFALRHSRRWTWLPLLGIAWVVGPLMGFCWPLHAPRESQPGLPLRVMTWNVKYATHNKLAHMAIIYDIDWNSPDVVLFQDSGGVLDGPVGKYLSKWNVRTNGQYVIASKLPLGDLQVLPISFPGEEATCLRTQLMIGEKKVALYNVHFQTPRMGLNALRAVKKTPRYLPNAIQQLESNVWARLIQVRTLQEYIQHEHGPFIVAGDLNSPDASQVCSILRGAGLHDAFDEGGKGYGYTYGHFLLQHRLPAFKASWMRIDHIMISSQFHARRCWTGNGQASDHRPVIADLVLSHD